MAEATQRQPQRGLSFDDVWAAMMETDRKFQTLFESQKETDQKFRETDRKFQTLFESQKETDQQFRETDRKFQTLFESQKETDQKFRETDRKFQTLFESQKETNQQFQETRKLIEKNAEEENARLQKLERLVEGNARQIKALNKQMGGLHSSFGELAEHLVAPGIAKKLNGLGYHFDEVSPGGKQILDEQGKVLTEIDLLLENLKYSVVVEVKTRPKETDIAHHLKRLEILRQHKDKHNDKRVVIGAIAGAVFPQQIQQAAIKAGLYVLVQSGDTMNIKIPEGFTPREWI